MTEQIIPIILFYTFAFWLVFSAVMVISVKNPVHAVLFLIFAFFNASGLFLLIGAELIAMMLVIVYVGAVAVLFLFVVMMLDINFAKMRSGFLRYLPIGALAAILLFSELFFVLRSSTLVLDKPLVGVRLPIDHDVSNAEAIGDVLYTDYIFAFQISGLILLIAMVGAIVLTLRSRDGVRKQVIDKQVNRRVEDSIELVKVKPGSGV